MKRARPLIALRNKMRRVIAGAKKTQAGVSQSFTQTWGNWANTPKGTHDPTHVLPGCAGTTIPHKRWRRPQARLNACAGLFISAIASAPLRIRLRSKTAQPLGRCHPCCAIAACSASGRCASRCAWPAAGNLWRPWTTELKYLACRVDGNPAPMAQMHRGITRESAFAQRYQHGSHKPLVRAHPLGSARRLIAIRIAEGHALRRTQPATYSRARMYRAMKGKKALAWPAMCHTMPGHDKRQ